MNSDLLPMPLGKWNELNREIMECALHVTTIALTGLRGSIQRGYRVMNMLEKNQQTRLELINGDADLRTLVDQETDILQRNNSEFVEDYRNLMQVSMFTHSELNYWQQRIMDILLNNRPKD